MRTSNMPKRAPVPVYMATTIVIFFLSLSAADSVGFVPYYVDGSEPSKSLALRDLPELGSETSEPLVVEEQSTLAVLPERIAISAIDLDLPVQNPNTRDIEELDEVLKDGPVRYVDSAQLGEKGNVLIFAHTSHLPVVHNQMYKAFNRISELKAGDSITVEGEGRTYIYTVTSVRQADAEEAIIDLSPSLGRKLTLVTCDTLTSKTSRFILEADFVATL
jgi:LPXTG-site transpeptidase (sortase) family protein